VEIGLLLPLSGSLADDVPAAKDAATLAIEEINNAGGVLERDLAIRAADDGSMPESTLSAARTLVDAGVVALVGPSGSSGALKVVGANLGVPLLVTTPASFTPGPAASPTASPLLPPVVALGASAGAYVSNVVDAKARVAVLAIDDPLARGVVATFVQQMQQSNILGDSPFTYPELADYTSYDFALMAEKILASRPDVIFLATHLQDGTAFLKAAAKHLGAGYRPLFVSLGLLRSPALLARVPAAAVERLVVVDPCNPAWNERAKTFASAYQRRWGREPGNFSDSVYDAVYLLAYAMVAAGRATRDAFGTALATVASPPGDKVGVGAWSEGTAKLAASGDINYEGASGSVDLSGMLFGSSSTCLWWVQNQQFVPLMPTQPGHDPVPP